MVETGKKTGNILNGLFVYGSYKRNSGLWGLCLLLCFPFLGVRLWQCVSETERETEMSGWLFTSLLK